MSKASSIEDVRGDQELPYENSEDIARRQIEAVVPPELRERMDRLGQRSLELLRTVGVELLDLVVERDVVEAAINDAFGSRPCEFELRFAGTGVETAGSALGLIEDLAGGSYSAEEHVQALLGESGPLSPQEGDADAVEGCEGCEALQRDRARLRRQVRDIRESLGRTLDVHDALLTGRAL